MLVKFNANDNSELYIESHRVVFVEQDVDGSAIIHVDSRARYEDNTINVRQSPAEAAKALNKIYEDSKRK